MRWALVPLLLAAGSCEWLPGAPIERRDRWSADLAATQQVLFLSFTRAGNELSGDGLLVTTSEPNGDERLTLAGTQRADSLELFLTGLEGQHYRVTGAYVLNGQAINGHLSGGRYHATSVLFRRY